MAIGEALLALILVVVVVLALLSYGPLWDLFKISIGFGKIDTNNLNNEKTTTTQAQKEIKAKLGAPFISRMEDQFNPKPTSPDYCLVTTSVTNTGETTWTDSDKIKIALFCKYSKSLDKTAVQNYPVDGYIKDLKPKQNAAITFNDQFPDNCLKSFEKYQIILYSNCEGIGASDKPCDNFGQANSPKIIDIVEFSCK